MTDINNLMNAWETLEPQARKVLLAIAKRLVAGQKEYGNMRVDKDNRDYIADMYEEALDFCVYYEMHQLRESLK